MNRLDRLNMEVTAAIHKVDEAQTELAHAELAIAKATSPTSREGRIARRGAIDAARKARLDGWAKSLVETFLSEKGIDEKWRVELKALGDK